MCGINGIFAYNASASAPLETELLATRDYMRARGPDGAGVWWSEDRRLGFGHRRLSIVDLSDRASQPMVSPCRRYVVTFNGEIYNYPELRRDFESQGHRFRTTSDTEILLHLYALRGEAMVSALRGMFAFAIWDTHARTLFLARDPYGIKPLYYANDGWTFRFASQIKALMAGGKISKAPEPAGIVGFHLWGSVPEPFTLYRDIRALPAGHTQLVTAAGPREPKSYVSIPQIFADGARRPLAAGEANARVREAALDSVRAHLLADVEVGVFLSAGIDSGALLGLMRDAGQKQIKAITLSFEAFRNTYEDEAPIAAEVAAYYGAEHIVRRIGGAEMQADMPAILEAMDQPSIDGVNSWFVSKAAREAGLKVALSGVGGDEILAGYPSFAQLPLMVSLCGPPSRIPGLGFLFRTVSQKLNMFPARPKMRSLLEYGGTYPGAYLLRRGLFMPHELPRLLDAEIVRVGLQRLKPLRRLRAAALRPIPSSPGSRVAALESATYLRNQLLRDADWAGMAHSLEIRTPLVDIAFLKALAPVTARLAPGEGKAALANAPSRPLPSSVTQRAKTGFVVPQPRGASPAGSPGLSKGTASRRWGREVFSSAPFEAAPA